MLISLVFYFDDNNFKGFITYCLVEWVGGVLYYLKNRINMYVHIFVKESTSVCARVSESAVNRDDLKLNRVVNINFYLRSIFHFLGTFMAIEYQSVLIN